MFQISQKENLILLGKAGVTIFCFAYLWQLIPLDRVIETVQGFDRVFLVIVFVTVFLRELFTTFSLKVLIDEVAETAFTEVVKIDSLATVANSIIPSQAGDLVSTPILISRYTELSKLDGARTKAIQFIWISVFTGSLSMLGLLVTRNAFTAGEQLFLLLSISIYLGFATAAVVTPYLPPIISNLLPNKMKQLSPDGKSFSHLTIGVSGFLLLGGFTATAFRFFLISNRSGISFPGWYFIFLPFLCYVVTVLPISIGNYGLAEAGGVTVLVALGVNSDIAATVVFTDRIFGAYLPLICYYTLGASLSTAKAKDRV